MSYGYGKWTVTVRNRRRFASAEMCLLKSVLKREANTCGKENSDHVEGIQKTIIFPIIHILGSQWKRNIRGPLVRGIVHRRI